MKAAIVDGKGLQSRKHCVSVMKKVLEPEEDTHPQAQAAPFLYSRNFLMMDLEQWGPSPLHTNMEIL